MIDAGLHRDGSPGKPRPLGRRGFALAGAATLLSRPASASADMGAALVVRPTEAFIGSVGVNVHLGSEPYLSRFAVLRRLLGDSLIRHIRDEVRPGNDWARWRDLHAAFGVRATLLASPATNTVAQAVEAVAALGAGGVSAIEGQNEGDSDWFMAQPAARGNWSRTVIAYQRDLFRAVRQKYPALPVLSPSVIDWKPRDAALLRGAAPFYDTVAIHPYAQAGQEPETAEPYAALDWYLRNFRDVMKPGAPVMATEAGYCTVVRPGSTGVSPQACAAYLPRLLLHHFGAGILRTFIYEFMDGGLDPADDEDNWGLVQHDGMPKPAYHAIRTLLHALAEPGPASAGTLQAALPARTADLRCVALRASGGALVLALWRAVRIWNPETRTDLAPQPQPATIQPDAPRIKAEWLSPSDGAAWTAVPAATGPITVPVGAHVMLLRLSAA